MKNTSLQGKGGWGWNDKKVGLESPKSYDSGFINISGR